MNGEIRRAQPEASSIATIMIANPQCAWLFVT